MSTVPRVSVVCTFLNGARFLAEAVESVLAQTFDAWELLLVDDGSTDTSTAIASAYARRYPDRIRCLAHPGHENRGISASRNLGVSHARGDLVAFIDADDVWLPAKLAEQVALLDRYPAAQMVYGPGWIWYGWTGRPEDIQRDRLQPLGVPGDSLIPPPTVISTFLRSEIMTPLPSSMLLRRQAIEAAGRFEERFRGFYEDQVFLTKLCLDAPVYAASACWHRYRQHPASYCATWAKTPHELEQELHFLSWVEAYLQAHGGACHGAAWAAVQQRLWPHRHPLRHRLRRAAHRLRARARHGVVATLRGLLPEPLYEAVIRRWRRYRFAALPQPAGERSGPA